LLLIEVISITTIIIKARNKFTAIPPYEIVRFCLVVKCSAFSSSTGAGVEKNKYGFTLTLSQFSLHPYFQ